MTNKFISSTVGGLQKTPFLATLLFLLFTGLTANSQTYEFRTVSFSKGATSSLTKVLKIDQTAGNVKVSFIFGSMNDIVFDTKIGDIFENDNSEIVVQNTDKESIAAVFVNNSGSEGYFIYHDDADDGYYKVILSKPENYLATFKKLKQAVESGAFSNTSKTPAKSNSTTAKTTTTPNQSNSTSTSTKTSAQTTTAKKDDNTPYTATVTNPKYYLRKPGQNVYYAWLINYDVVNSRQMDRWNYLYVQNADTKQWLKSSKTGKDWFHSSANGTNNLTFDLTADELPHATEGKPIRLKMWIYMATPSREGWIGKFETPVFIWDGKYMRQE